MAGGRLWNRKWRCKIEWNFTKDAAAFCYKIATAKRMEAQLKCEQERKPKPSKMQQEINKTEHTAPPKRNQQKLAKIEQACTTLRQKIFHRNAKSKVFEHGLDDPASWEDLEWLLPLPRCLLILKMVKKVENFRHPQIPLKLYIRVCLSKKTRFPEIPIKNGAVDRFFENFSAKKTLITRLLREEAGIRIPK